MPRVYCWSLFQKFVRNSLLTCGLVLLLVGCENPDIVKLAKPAWIPQRATWPELEALDSDPEAQGGLGYYRLNMVIGQAEPNDIKNIILLLQHAFVEPGFVQRLEKFRETPIPAQFQTPEREAIKNEYVKSWKDMEDLSKKSPKLDVLKQKLADLTTLRAKVQFIAGQQPPTGDEVKKYSSVIPYENPYEKK